MTFFVRPIAVFAIGSLLVAGCGSGDNAPHPVDQPAPTTIQPGLPGQADNSVRLPAEQPTYEQPPELIDQQPAARRGFWTSPRPRAAFGEWTMRQTAFDALSRIGPLAVPALIDLLDEPDRQLRIDALVALARIGPEAREAVPRLTGLVEKDPDEAVRKNAVRALGQIGPAAAPAIPELVEQLRAEVGTPAGDEHPARRVPSDENSRGNGRPTGPTQPADSLEPADER